MDRNRALQVLREQTFVTVGCTDPGAVGLAVAEARRLVGGEILGISVEMDRNVYKDALSVGIPGTFRSGLRLAVALAALFGDPQDGLEIFRNVDDEKVREAEGFMASVPIGFSLKEDAEGIHVHAVVTTAEGVGEATIAGYHDRIVRTARDGLVLKSLEEGQESCGGERPFPEFRDRSMADLLGLALSFTDGEIAFLAEGMKMNMAAAEVGLDRDMGLRLGRMYGKMLEEGVLSSDLANRVRMRVGGAADARMAGAAVPIMGCFGSGNHGITLFVTLALAGEHMGASPESLNRALAIALLVIGAVKNRTGILTPHCGCATAAGAGAAAAIAWLLGGTPERMLNAVHLMMASLTGMICDGAKYGCAVKMATAAGLAVETGYMAALFGGQVPPDNGIVGEALKESMGNLQVITDEGMKDVDRAVLEILLRKGR